jgi:protein-S-isoprenylcysteine O-methyltransferase Ste14
MDARRQSMFSALQIVAMGILFYMLATLKRPWDVQRCAGTALAVVGVGMIALARYQLGKSFAIRAEAHQLVTHGLYSKIRNPIYVFGLVAFIGVAMVVQMPVLWMIVAAMAVAQVVRARRESRVLESAFGESYREYRRKTWF